MVNILSAKEAGALACRNRMAFEYHVQAVCADAIQRATDRGEQSCTVTLRSLAMPELCAKRTEGLLNKLGYKTTHSVSKDGTITIGVCWLPSMEEIAPELFKLTEGK